MSFVQCDCNPTVLLALKKYLARFLFWGDISSTHQRYERIWNIFILYNDNRLHFGLPLDAKQSWAQAKKVQMFHVPYPIFPVSIPFHNAI